MSASISQNSSRKKSFFPLLPILPIGFFFFHNLSQFMELILRLKVLLLFTVYIGIALVLFACFKMIFRMTRPQSLFASAIFMIFFLFFGAFQDFFFKWLATRFLSNSLLLFALCAVFVFTIVLLSRKKKVNVSTFNNYLTLLLAFLICYEAGGVVLKIARGKTMKTITSRMISPVLADQPISTAPGPDIYHIIFDEYTNRPVLNRFWGYDNEVYAYLDSAGFFTADSATSNYTSTPFSISSIFSLQYLNGANAFLPRNSSNFAVGQLVFQKNPLFPFLKKHGYRFSLFSMVDDENLSTSMGFLGLDGPADWMREKTFERLLINPWILNKIKSLFGKGSDEPSLITSSKKEVLEYNGKAMDHILADCSATSGSPKSTPVFSFTHFMLPHEPYMLDEKGNVVPLSDQQDDMKGYLRQVKYSNLLIKQITSCLLRDTTRDKIIIIQGDHGYRNLGDSTVSFNSQYGALSAIYFYNKNYDGMRKDLSHANTYRVVLNKFFNAHLPMLKDSIFWKR